MILETCEYLWLIFLALPLTFLIVFIRFYRWYKITKYDLITFPFWEGLLIYIASFGLGIITPGRVGELIKVNYLRHNGYRIGQALFTVIVDRLSDITLMIMVALIGSCIMFDVYQDAIIKIALTTSVLLGGSIYYLYKRSKRSNVSKDSGKDNRDITSVFFRELDQIPKQLKKIGWLGAGILGIISAVSWILFFLQNFLFSFSFGFNLNFFQIAFVTSIAGLVTLIPISVSGLGTRDLTLIYLFSHLGLEKEKALIFSGCMFFTVIIYGLISFVPWEITSIREKLLMLKKKSNESI